MLLLKEAIFLFFYYMYIMEYTRPASILIPSHFVWTDVVMWHYIHRAAWSKQLCKKNWDSICSPSFCLHHHYLSFTINYWVPMVGIKPEAWHYQSTNCGNYGTETPREYWFQFSVSNWSHLSLEHLFEWQSVTTSISLQVVVNSCVVFSQIQI